MYACTHTHTYISTKALFCHAEPERNTDVAFATVKTQEILQGTVVRESAEGHGTVEWVLFLFQIAFMRSNIILYINIAMSAL